jgi:glycogen debranching enzyme
VFLLAFFFCSHNFPSNSGFSPANSPHLTPALELDSAIIQLSSELAAKGLPTSVANQRDLDTLVSAFQGVVKDLNLWQYYVLDVTREKDSVKAALTSNKVVAWDGSPVVHKTVVEIAEIVRASGKIHGLGKFASRFGVSVDPGVAAGLVKAAFVDVSDIDSLAEAWVRVIDVINVPLYQEWEEDTKTAVDNVKNRLSYTRLDEHGPRLGEISKSYVV